MLSPLRLDNMDIVVKDVPAMVEFYKNVLGLPLHPHGYEPEKGWAMFMFGDTDLVLLSVPDAPRDAHQRTGNYVKDPAGVHSFAIGVADLYEAIEDLDRHGIRWADKMMHYGAGGFLECAPKDDFPGIWYRFRSFYDPEGNVTHLCEVHPPKGFDRSRFSRPLSGDKK